MKAAILSLGFLGVLVIACSSAQIEPAQNETTTVARITTGSMNGTTGGSMNGTTGGSLNGTTGETANGTTVTTMPPHHNTTNAAMASMSGAIVVMTSALSALYWRL